MVDVTISNGPTSLVKQSRHSIQATSPPAPIELSIGLKMPPGDVEFR